MAWCCDRRSDTSYKVVPTDDEVSSGKKKRTRLACYWIVTVVMLVVTALFIGVFSILPTRSRSFSLKPVWNSEEVPALTNRPIIGIMAMKATNKSYGDEQIQTSYVQYLQSAGARVVPIRGNQSPEYYANIFKKINGLMFPGGHAYITMGMPLRESAEQMYRLALEANDKGDYFPIWGICLGFELLVVLATGGRETLDKTDAKNFTQALNFVDDAKKSRLLKNIPKDMMDYLSSGPVTQHNHAFGLLYEDYLRNPRLLNIYKVVSTSFDREGVEFVSTFEGHKYPFYGSQWHPEKNVFHWNPDDVVPHSYADTQVTNYMANFFINEARKNGHRFDSHEEEARANIETAPRVYKPDMTYMAYYYFNFSDPSPF